MKLFKTTIEIEVVVVGENCEDARMRLKEELRQIYEARTLEFFGSPEISEAVEIKNVDEVPVGWAKLDGSPFGQDSFASYDLKNWLKHINHEKCAICLSNTK